MIWGEGEPGVVYRSWCSLARFISTPWAGFKLARGSHLQAWGSLGCSWSPGSFPCSLPSLLLWFSLLYSQAPCATAAGNLLCKALMERLRCCSCPYKSPGTWKSIPNPSNLPLQRLCPSQLSGSWQSWALCWALEELPEPCWEEQVHPWLIFLLALSLSSIPGPPPLVSCEPSRQACPCP